MKENFEYRCRVINFTANKSTIKRLYQLNEESAKVWNHCLDLVEHAYASGHEVTKSFLFSYTKGYYRLQSACVNAICERFLEARKGAYESRQMGNNANYPTHRKTTYPTRWKENGISLLGTGPRYKECGNSYSGVLRLSTHITKDFLYLKVKNISYGDIIYVDLIERYGLLKLVITERFPLKEKPYYQESNFVGIDMGEIHSFSCYDSNQNACIVTGRELRSLNRLRNKQLGEIQKLQAACEKYSKRWKELQNAKLKMLERNSNQQKDLIHKITTNTIRWCIQHRVTKIIIGDIADIARNTKKEKRLSRKNRQKMSNWATAQLLSKLAYKAKSNGIDIVVIDESYTTKTCPACGSHRKPRGRVYECSCGYIAHRDIHGARNILLKGTRGEIRIYQEDNIQMHPKTFQYINS